MLLLVAGISAFQLGAIGTALGALCIVVALVWKVWAARLAPKLMERAKRMTEEGTGHHTPDDSN